MSALHLHLLVNHHVIAQIVKSQLIVGAVGNIGGVRLLAFFVIEILRDQSDRETHILIELAHPLGVTARKIVIDGNDVHAITGESIQIGRQSRHKGFTFTGFHLGDTSLVQHNATDNLYGEVLHAQHTPPRLTADGKSIRENIICGLSVRETFLQDHGLIFELILAHSCILFFKCKHFVNKRLNSLYLALAVITKH